MIRSFLVAVTLMSIVFCSPLTGEQIQDVEGQPLAANVARLIEALQYLGAPLSGEMERKLLEAGRQRDAAALQQLLDPQVLVHVAINAEARVKVRRGSGPAQLQQAGYVPVLIKIHNQSTITQRLRLVSPQAGPVYGGVSRLSMFRQQQEELRANENTDGSTDRFLSVEVFTEPPMTDRLSGLEVEYALALIYSSESGRREATLGVDVGQGNQDLGFRGEIPVLFEIAPLRPVALRVRDFDGEPTMARLLIRDKLGRVYPPQPKRLAPDLFFQPHIYRADGEFVGLPPGRFDVEYSRGPEYRVLRRSLTVPPTGEVVLDLRLERWVDPAAHGYFSGDHHIHAAGCAHYNSPTQGVTPPDMFRQVKGEGLNVGCVLTWGPCFDFQRQYFSPGAAEISEPLTVLKYDLEISGFGSQALGHVCLLNLRNQTYPGSEGTATKGWPSWTTPVMRWAKEQGGVTGYAHSASGLSIDPDAAAGRLITQGDRNGDREVSRDEAQMLLLPAPFERIDLDNSDALTGRELETAIDQAADRLPNLAIPEMNGVGAMEICVSTAEGVCDFISAMDTARIQEWNTWYHLLNCGFPIKVSGETDFPCMSGRRVGQGRVYVNLGDVQVVDFSEWCGAMAAGRSYVSDGYAHALNFQVNGASPGEADVRLNAARKVIVTADVCFAPEIPRAVAHGTQLAERERRRIGDTVLLHGERVEEVERGGTRDVEVVVNGVAVASQTVRADGELHAVRFEIPIAASSWIALRQFPQLHTNPVNVLVDNKPIRASRSSARWCQETIRLLWHNRERRISEPEREAARAAFDRALKKFQQIADES